MCTLVGVTLCRCMHVCARTRHTNAATLRKHSLQLEAERRLRELAEEQGRITLAALETEKQRMAARAMADEQALKLQV